MLVSECRFEVAKVDVKYWVGERALVFVDCGKVQLSLALFCLPHCANYMSTFTNTQMLTLQTHVTRNHSLRRRLAMTARERQRRCILIPKAVRRNLLQGLDTGAAVSC